MENDAQLIRRILSGDDDAFDTLVRRHQRGVHALAWRKVSDFHYAEEITQDTFLQAYKKLSTLKNPNQFAGWLYVIANRLCINWIQRHKPAMQSLEDTPMAEIEESSYTHYAAEQRDAEGTEHRYAIAEKLLSKLPESERTVMTLHYLGEMTAKEISKFLGVSVNTITNRLWRARKRLREDQELMVQEVLGGVQFPTNLTENIMRQVAELKPTPPPVAKPLLPWGALGVATLLVAMLLGATNQYLARFQKPYSFEAVAEPTVEIVDTAILLDIDSKPDLRNQVGRPVSADKNVEAGLQAAETPLISDTQRNPLGPATLQWTRKADMPTARTGFATSVVNGKVFVIGGNIQLKRDEFGDLSTSRVEMYDPKTDTWEQKASIPTARSGVSVSVVDGKIYAIGGTKTKTIQVPRGFSSESEELATVEMYDPVTDTWTQKADLPTPKKTMTCVVSGKIYAIGGWLTANEKPHLGTVEVYDPGTDTWAKAQSMNCARCSAAIDVVNGEIYAIGGLSSSPIQDESDLYLSSVEVFNPKTNQWEEKTEMPAPKALHTASVIDGKIYVIGGYFKKDGEFKKLSTIEIYDPTTDRWTQASDMPIGKWGHKTEVIDGQIYIFGGGPVTSVQVYDPR
ncbi:MAG: sigma-70 family RNA polymerase sigma factor [Candidatus Poribacteria bacterium]|nr:sigma-70 family RNA polymerase sigma factor [Candidatus Poribacteria bacterium]